MILHTSRYLFDQHGFHNVGVDRISKESNVSKMTFYKYFKRALLHKDLKVKTSHIYSNLSDNSGMWSA
ncbi:helix-turn-helix domain-containing protein [Acinetobacter baumannii]